MDIPENDSYSKRQWFVMSNLWIFYLILIAMFSVPLLGTFVVILIKGALDFKYIIIGGGTFLMLILLLYLIFFIRKVSRKFKEDGFAAKNEVMEKMNQGEPVQISMFKGLVTFSYGGNKYQALPYLNSQQGLPQNIQLLAEPEPKKTSSKILDQLKDLSALKNDNVINEEEFNLLKQRLIDNFKEEDEQPGTKN